jgi:hypothetical protein
MIDPLVTLAFSVYSNKGIYALLLGSGISTAAEIPTGWAIVLDLIRKVAVLEGSDCEPDPYAWFIEHHKEPPDYSKLLDSIAKTPSERQSLLAGYFQPTEAERADGLKLPTTAHKEIARLVAGGFIRLILTTNFDRLLEQALEVLGVPVTVISTSDAIAGAIPLTHAGVTIVKVNGDYLDTRIRNTEHELASYDQATNTLLDRVFDEYGLIVCGWSSDWDLGLRGAIERCASRRYTTFWTTRSDPSDSAERLITQRRAQLIRITGANEFFATLHEKVQALADFEQPHPLSAKLAIATAKRYLTDRTAVIKLTDLVRTETERLYAGLTDQAFPCEAVVKSPTEFLARLTKYEGLCEILLSILVVGCHWGEREQAQLWIKSLSRIAHPSTKETGFEFLVKMQMYPALYLFYGAAVAAIAGDRYETLADLMSKITVRGSEEEEKVIGFTLYPDSVMKQQQGRQLPDRDRQYTPLSNHLRQTLREPLKDYLPEERDFDNAFDQLEYLFALRYWQYTSKHTGYEWAPLGSFAWRSRYRPQHQIAVKLDAEIAELGVEWPPLKYGLLQGPIEQLKEIKASFDKYVQNARWG